MLIALAKNFPEEISFELLFLPIYFLIAAVLVSFLALIPGILGGIAVQNLLTLRKMFDRTSKISGTVIGALGGALAGIAISSTVIYLDYQLVSSTGHGSVSVNLIRSKYGSLIATIAGAWAGNQIDQKLITKPIDK
ncbi:MAG: hypothetical protein HND51_17895 [Chloroflexi bacterium]|nr:hypothetical protein [Chloroflexota bacterium]